MKSKSTHILTSKQGELSDVHKWSSCRPYRKTEKQEAHGSHHSGTRTHVGSTQTTETSASVRIIDPMLPILS